MKAVSIALAALLLFTLAACGSPQRLAAAPRIKVFSAQPVVLTDHNHEVTLNWEVEGPATELWLDPGVGRVTGSSARVAPKTTTIYRLTATNDAGSHSATTTVTLPTKPGGKASPLAGPWVFEIVGDAGTAFSGEFLAATPLDLEAAPGLWGAVSECQGAAPCALSALGGVIHEPGRYRVALAQADMTPIFVGEDSDAQLAENTPRHLLLEGRGRLAGGEAASFRAYQLGK